MGPDQIRHLIAQVFKTWTPSQVDVRDIYPHAVRFTIVSDRFQGLGLEARIEMAKDQIRQADPVLCEKMIWSIEPYTYAEAQGLTESEDEENSSEESSTPLKRAVSPPDATPN